MSKILVKSGINEPNDIKLKFPDGEIYTLEFSRESVVFAQQRGFNENDVLTKYTIAIPDLFYYAMRKNHKNISREKVDKIRLTAFPDGLPKAVVERLVELYIKAGTAQVINLDEEAELKNAQVEVEM